MLLCLMDSNFQLAWPWPPDAAFASSAIPWLLAAAALL